MLIDPQIEAFYGAIERLGKGSIRTLFVHVAGLPVFPKGTYWVVSKGVFDRRPQVMRLAMQARSVVAGYLRGTMMALSLWALVVAITLWFIPNDGMFEGDPMPLGHTALSPLSAGVAVLAAGLGLVVWALTRFPVRGEARAHRLVYLEALGAPVDPAILPNPWSERDDLERAMAERAERHGWAESTLAYERWSEIAAGPECTDPGYLKMALTVARLSKAAPSSNDPADLDALHQRIWTKLCLVDPAARA